MRVHASLFSSKVVRVIVMWLLSPCVACSGVSGQTTLLHCGAPIFFMAYSPTFCYAQAVPTLWETTHVFSELCFVERYCALISLCLVDTLLLHCGIIPILPW